MRQVARPRNESRGVSIKNQLTVTSTGFADNGYMPLQYTGYGIDQSPPLSLAGLANEAKSLSIIMVDLDIPLIREYPHWLIWDIPAITEIPAAISQGETLTDFYNAKQGVAYGKHEYKGPKPPKFLHNRHRYVFTIYALDTMLSISGNANKKELLKAMQGHIIQQDSIMGLYKNG